MLYNIFVAICALVLKISGCRIKITGIENIPDSGPFILASNHLSNIDPVLLGVINRRKKLNYMAKSELFRIPVLSWILRHSNTFPVRRNTADPAAVRQAVERLKKGEGLVVFPEGTRGASLKSDFKVNRGVGFLARVADAPIVPVYINGSDLSMPKGSKRIRSAEIRVSFAKAIRLEEKRSDIEASQIVMDKIKELK